MWYVSLISSNFYLEYFTTKYSYYYYVFRGDVCTIDSNLVLLDNATTVQTRDSRITDQRQFINALALLVPIDEHINHPENTNLYIAFSFTEKQGPIRVAAREFDDATVLKLLSEFSDSKKNAITYLVFLVAERLQPLSYSRNQELPSLVATDKSTKTGELSSSNSQSQLYQKDNKSELLIEKEKVNDKKKSKPAVRLYNFFCSFYCY